MEESVRLAATNPLLDVTHNYTPWLVRCTLCAHAFVCLSAPLLAVSAPACVRAHFEQDYLDELSGLIASRKEVSKGDVDGLFKKLCIHLHAVKREVSVRAESARLCTHCTSVLTLPHALHDEYV